MSTAHAVVIFPAEKKKRKEKVSDDWTFLVVDVTFVDVLEAAGRSRPNGDPSGTKPRMSVAWPVTRVMVWHCAGV